MCRTLGWTLRTYLYGGWLATSGNGVRLNRKLLTTSSDSALDSARSRVITYRLMTMTADTSKVARRRTDPGGRFILQVPLSMPIGLELGGAESHKRAPSGRTAGPSNAKPRDCGSMAFSQPASVWG